MPENLKHIAVLDLIIEVGIVRMRVGIGSKRLGGYLPRMCLLVDQRSGMVLHFEMTEPAESYLPLVVQSLAKLITQIGGAPRQIQMRDPALAREVKAAINPAIEVVVRESLPMLDEAVDHLMDFKKLGGKPQPGLLDPPGMTLDHVIAFADAAQAFYEAAPWRYLSDDDLIQIESPQPPPGCQFTQVLGAGGQTFGLGFVASLKAHEQMHAGGGIPRGGVWSLLFGDIDHLPFEDGELFEQHNLPVARGDAYPTFLNMSKSRGATHPTAEQLVWAEGLLRAIAATSEDELDRGEWEKPVTALSGPQLYRLSMPLLLAQMRGEGVTNPATAIAAGRATMESAFRAVQKKLGELGPAGKEDVQRILNEVMTNPPSSAAPTTPAEQAQAMCYQAMEARGRRQVQLARQALIIDPDCCDAHVLLGERAGDSAKALELFRRAVDAGERQLGPELFHQQAGHFWGILETRPYMRARERLALTFMDQEQFDDAADHFNEMLRLNPNDNQGVRYPLAQCLLYANRLDELDELLNRSEYRDDFSAEWAFTRTLLAYRRAGDSPQARQQLAEARNRNRFVAPLLTAHIPMPPMLPESYQPGSEDEAVLCVEQIADAWHETKGALDWLEGIVARVEKAARQASREREKRKKRKR